MYTYDVYWDTSDITWSSRWDAYLRMPGGKVHWFSILNSVMVVVSALGAVLLGLVGGQVGGCEAGRRGAPFGWSSSRQLGLRWAAPLFTHLPAAPRHAGGHVVHRGHDHDAHHPARPAALRAAAGGRRCGERGWWRVAGQLGTGAEGAGTAQAASYQQEAVRLGVTHLDHPNQQFQPHPSPPTGQGQEVEESGWKMVSGDVFRAPSSPLSLCVQVGSGVQIVASGFITLFFAALVGEGLWSAPESVFK